MVGGLFPGMPVIALGHNRHLGWSHTVNDPDLIDVYELEVNSADPNQYRFDGEWRELEVFDISIKVKLWGSSTVDCPSGRIVVGARACDAKTPRNLRYPLCRSRRRPLHGAVVQNE